MHSEVRPLFGAILLYKPYEFIIFCLGPDTLLQAIFLAFIAPIQALNVISTRNERGNFNPVGLLEVLR